MTQKFDGRQFQFCLRSYNLPSLVISKIQLTYRITCVNAEAVRNLKWHTRLLISTLLQVIEP